MSKRNVLLISVVIVVLAIVIFSINKNGDYDTYSVERGQFTDTTEIAGKIVPAQELDLAFEIVGKIKNINVDTGDFVEAGDVLLELDTSEISNELSEVIANLEKEQSRLAEVSGDITSQNKLQNSGEKLLQNIKKSYVTADDIVKNKVDVFFDNPNSRIPEFTNALSDYFLRIDIRKIRYDVGQMLIEWESDIANLDPLIVDNSDANNSIENLRLVEDLLALITSDVDEYKPTGDITESEIDSFLTSISNSRNSISLLVADLNNAYNDFRSVQAELPVLESSVNNARASVGKISARQDKYVLRAPFSGVITEQELERGQVVSANETVVSMISDEAFEVEGFVPELNIIGVNVGDQSVLHLDAFGDDVNFLAEVSHVDPRETIKDGVTTYRILLTPFESDDEIRSGMTVDIEIIKEVIDNQIIIPRYLVLENDEGSYVEIYMDGEIVNKKIVLGKTDGKGGVVVLDGISEGDKIIIKE
jgi:RND family efflux transporter MFP subunit